MKIIALFTIFVLIFGTTSFVNDAYAQNDLSILLRIATQADKQIQNQLHQVYGNDVPEKIQFLYDKGHMTVNSLEKSLPDDAKQAKKDFLTSMKLFKQISKMISEPVVKVQVILIHSDQSSQLERLEKYVLTLKTISKKLDAKINFENIDDLLLKTRNQINNGTEIPSEIIIQLKSSITSIEKDIREFASHSAFDRIKQFVDRELDRIEKKLDKAEEIGADQNQINKAHELIDEIKILIDKNQINDAKIVFHELHKLLKNIQYSVG
ncbi:MAG: hypothetical protein CMO15_05700 [Thaumarchaeota archaeon]|nr:hypothetical protein [Nitrososphaerota archaeon]